jgi:cytochrome c
MPPYSPRVAAADIQSLVRFILALEGANSDAKTFLFVDAAPLFVESNQGGQANFHFLSYSQRTYAVNVKVSEGVVDVAVQSDEGAAVAQQIGVDSEALLEFEAASGKHNISVFAAADAGYYVSVADVTPEPPATDMMDLAKRSGCLACHAVNQSIVGPSWQAVSERYLNDPNAETFLIEKVTKGGKGNWADVTGGAPMPPYSPRVSDENIQALVQFILNIAQ